MPGPSHRFNLAPIMAEDESKKKHALFGSAGMAAAGMIHTGRGSKKAKVEKPVAPPAPEAPDPTPVDEEIAGGSECGDPLEPPPP